VGWPQPTEYNEAIQNPRLCFNDSELQAGQAAEDALGMPRPYSGNFADVYQVRHPDGRAWAVKCFTREVPTLQMRYQAISQHLRGGSPSFMVNFHYQVEGIRVQRRWYPLLKMDWVEGFTLNEFVRKYVDLPKVMFKLAQKWVKLSLQLRQAHMAHADLQHGNVLLVPGEKTSQLSLRLIDYDGMHVPALAQSPSGEVGHPNYQHPQRLREGVYSPEVDRFPHLVIYTALRCLIVGGRELWSKYDNGENLLFREQDFSRSQESPLLLDAWQLPDPDVRRLLGHLVLGSHMPFDRVPRLDEVVGGEGRPLGLTAGQEHQLFDLLPPAAARMKMAPAMAPRFTLEELIEEGDDEPLTEGAEPVAAPAPAAGLQLPVNPFAPAVADRPRRRTAVHPPASNASLPAGTSRATCRPFLPWLRAPCPRCGLKKHVLEAICPHCRRVDYVIVQVASALAILCGVAAVIWLPHSQPGLTGVLGLLAAPACVLLAPLAVLLGGQILMRSETAHQDARSVPVWPGGEEPCRRCGRLLTLPLFVCRYCGRMAWARLAALATAVLLDLTFVSLSQAHPDAGTWWAVVVAVARWVGRLVGVAGGIVWLAGVFEVWKLQSRLPREGRIRHAGATLALLAATLAPVVAVVLLIVGLLANVQAAAQ
jgi:hypothetical protein